MDTNHEPHSMTFKTVDQDGFEWLICIRSSATMEDVDNMFAMAKHAKDKAMKAKMHPVPTAAKAPTSNGTSGNAHTGQATGWCTIHNVQMKQNTKDGHTWFSHKDGENWCRGK